MDFSTMNIWCWLIPLLVGLLCAYFGYLLGKNKSTTTIDNSADLKLLQDKNAKLQADLDACKGKLSAGAAMAAAGGAVAAASMAPEPPKEKLIPFDAAAVIKYTIQPHGQCKQKCAMKVNGKNLPSGKMNTITENYNPKKIPDINVRDFYSIMLRWPQPI